VERGKRQLERNAHELREFVKGVDSHRVEAAARTSQLNVQVWRALAGGECDKMMASPGTARGYLSHPDSKVRMAALSILTRHFGLWEETQAECERMADADIAASVRLCAKLCLVSCYQRAGDPRGKQVLARIVRDGSEADETRLSCYALLRSLHDPSPPKQPEHFPGDVDWEFVDEMLNVT